jgi:formylglycine-generating enzyme required for sulfatase activity
LNKQTGRKYRLPTEAEWEYAARSGGKSERWSGAGNDVLHLDDFAWFEENSTQPHNVGTKKPNGLGLYDISGNVSEWCQDWFDENYYIKSPRKNPRGPLETISRVVRGGNWQSHAYSLRTTSRDRLTPHTRLSTIGFRLALSPEE